VPLLHERGRAVYLKSPIPVGWLVRPGWVEAAVALALGYALYTLSSNLAYLLVDVLAQHLVDANYPSVTAAFYDLYGPTPQHLNFRIGETVIFYGFVLAQALALVFVSLAGYGLWRWRLSRLAECPHCLSRIPRGATVCRECSLETAS
jgi:hypothetical protein